MTDELKRRKKKPLRTIARDLFDQPTLPKDALYFGRSPKTGEYVYIRPKDLDTHLHVIGGSRRGKTNALRFFVGQLLKRKKRTGEGFAIIDPHGGLAEYSLELASKEPALASEVAYLTLQDADRVLSINPLRRSGTQDPYFAAACVKEALIKVFDQARSQDKPLVSRVLVNVAQALIEQQLTLLESRHFLNRGQMDNAVLASLVEKMPQGDLRSFWENFLTLPPREAEMQALGPSNRLDDLIRPPALRRMLGQSAVSLDFLELMNRGGIAIFNTSIGNTEITADGQALFNALLVQQFRQNFPRRTEKGARDYDPKRTPPFTLVMDEFGSYTSPEFARTLTEASKFGLRCVFAHQNLAQLVPPDGDRQLLQAVLAIPNKLVFGNLPFDEAQQLALHMYLADLDPDEIKYQGEQVTWDPVLKWGTTAVTRSHTTSAGTTRGTGGTKGSGRSVQDDGSEVASESESDSESEVSTESESSSESETEGYYTTHEMRIQKQTPLYRPVEEQVFKAAQTLSTNHRGVCVLGVEERRPVVCQVPMMDERPASEDETAAFLLKMYEQPYYLAASEADRLIEDRQRHLLEAAPPPEGRVKRSRFGPAPKAVAKPAVQEDAPRVPPQRVLATNPQDVSPQAEPDLVDRYVALNLPHHTEVKRGLNQAALCYSRSEWREAIFNYRRVLETVFLEAAIEHARQNNRRLSRHLTPKEVRDCLRDQRLLDQHGWAMAGQAYDRLSNSLHAGGSEPAQEDALMWSRQALILAEFVLIRLKNTSEKKDE